MHIPELHSWDLAPRDARALQRELRAQLVSLPLPADPALVAGADLAFDKPGGRCFAAVLVLDFPSLEVVETVTAEAPLAYPYVPGLLTFREGPALVDAFLQVQHAPDVVIFDGQGIAHPERMGLAAHMGLWLGLPTVGCAKSRLTGEHEEPARREGSSVPLTDGDECIGTVLRTRTGVRPVYVSPGHLSDIDSARDLVLRCAPRYRLPEPTRLAHQAVSAFKRERTG